MIKRKIVIDHDMCIGCASCVGIFSEDFELNSDGLAEAITGEADEEAINVCPVGAIALED